MVVIIVTTAAFSDSYILTQQRIVSLFLSVYISVLSDSVCQCHTCLALLLCIGLFAPFKKYRISV